MHHTGLFTSMNNMVYNHVDMVTVILRYVYWWTESNLSICVEHTVCESGTFLSVGNAAICVQSSCPLIRSNCFPNCFLEFQVQEYTVHAHAYQGPIPK